MGARAPGWHQYFMIPNLQAQLPQSDVEAFAKVLRSLRGAFDASTFALIRIS
jgi:hypothetical protein